MLDACHHEVLKVNSDDDDDDDDEASLFRSYSIDRYASGPAGKPLFRDAVAWS